MLRHRHPLHHWKPLRSMTHAGKQLRYLREVEADCEDVQRNHHIMMGMEEDPEDGAAVAASIFIAVAVYAVSDITWLHTGSKLMRSRDFLWAADFKLGYMGGRGDEAPFPYDPSNSPP